VVAIASDGAYHFGLAEGTLIAQAKLNARMVVPRFLSQGDAFALPVVVQNLSEQPRTIDVAVRAANLASRGATAKRVTVPGGQRAELRFGFATEQRGRAAIQVVAISGGDADASTQEVQVYAPATTESFATYGTVDSGAAFEQLAVPKDLYPEVGGLEVELASTQLQSLTDAYWYLFAYPYECAEQRSSRMLATQAMASLLDAFAAPGRPTAKQIEQQRLIDVAKLTETQLPGGGWGYFAGMTANPFVSIQVVSALGKSADARAVGFVQKLVAGKLAALEKAAKQKPIDRANRDELPADASLAATGLAALMVTGSRGAKVTAQVDRLDRAARALDAYPMDAKARVLALRPTAAPARAKLLAELLSAIHETAAGATLTTTYTPGERLLLVSNPKTTALALDAILRESPQQPIATKLARGLLAARAYGRWRSTQENLAVMRAMRRYFDTYEKTAPNYTGKLWIGNVAYTEQAFAGHTNVRARAALDWTRLAPGTTHELALAKTGPGRMYYRIGITYAPKQIDLPALDAGFVVRRSYQAVDDPRDVEVTPSGVRIKLGARVLVVLDAVNTTRRDSVALVDPLPAGLEIVNTSLKIAERAATGSISRDWNHLEARDNRSEAFALTLREGTHRFSYTARATTPGTFVAAPAKAEEMYSPETFGRSAGTTVTIY
jgi:alpha-2-macroglobulin